MHPQVTVVTRCRPGRIHLHSGGRPSRRGSSAHHIIVCTLLWTCVFAAAPPQQRNPGANNIQNRTHRNRAAAADWRARRAHSQRNGAAPSTGRARRQEDSCDARGCGSYLFSAPCNCDPDCGLYSDCCPDYSTTCDTETTTSTTTEDSTSLSKNSCTGVLLHIGFPLLSPPSCRRPQPCAAHIPFAYFRLPHRVCIVGRSMRQ